MQEIEMSSSTRASRIQCIGVDDTQKSVNTIKPHVHHTTETSKATNMHVHYSPATRIACLHTVFKFEVYTN